MAALIAKVTLTFVILFTLAALSFATPPYRYEDAAPVNLPLNTAPLPPPVGVLAEESAELAEENSSVDPDLPDMSQFESEDILLSAADVFSGSTLIEMLPDFPAFLSNLHYPSNQSECCKCVKFAAKKVLEHVAAHIKHVCEHTKCPHIKKHCEWMAKHPKFALGTLIYHVRPHSLGFSYCIGAEKCKHHDKDAVLAQDPVQGDPLSGELLLELVERNQTVAEALSAELTAEDLQQLEASMEELDPENAEDEAEGAEDADDGAEGGLPLAEGLDGCKLCVHWTSFLVMKHHVERLVKLCKDTKCPIVKAHCKWVAHNFSEWLGMSTAHVRPEEFAFGFCLGQHSCSAGERHRHSASELQG